MTRNARTADRYQIIGWRELIALPAFGITSMAGKIDTGARTSALNATALETFEQNDEAWIRFSLPFADRGKDVFEMRLADQRRIKNTGGVWQRRPIIETAVVLGERQWSVQVSLTDREEMGHDLILGRTALRRNRMVVNPRRSYLAGPPVLKT